MPSGERQRPPALKRISEFSGGLPGLADALNKIVKVVNAIVDFLSPNGPGSNVGGNVNAYWTVINDDGSVTLRRVQASGMLISAPITGADQIG